MRKIKADGLRKINVFFLKEQGYFSGARWGTIQWTSNFHGDRGSASLQITILNGTKYLHIRSSESKHGMQEGYEREVALVTTACHYGGVRYWLICPSSGCGRRVGTVYFGYGRFACRHCFNLTYASQNRSKRYNGFISFPMIDAMAERVKRTHYRGRPTKKYKKYLSMRQRCLAQMGVSSERFNK